MRSLKRRESVVKHLAPTITTSSTGSKTVTWVGTPATLSGFVQPLDSVHFRGLYGERSDRMQAIFLPNGTFAVGDGIWIGSESTALPPWIIVSVKAWLDMTSLIVEKRS